MTLSILIIYIISIFISRQWNKILYKYDSQYEPFYQLWFIPLLNILMMLIATFNHIFNHIKPFDNNFTGKNWKSKN